MQTGLELLKTGELRVRRPDSDQLTAVRDGGLSFEALQSRATELEAQMREAADRTALPDRVDYDFVDKLAFELLVPK